MLKVIIIGICTLVALTVGLIWGILYGGFWFWTIPLLLLDWVVGGIVIAFMVGELNIFKNKNDLIDFMFGENFMILMFSCHFEESSSLIVIPVVFIFLTFWWVMAPVYWYRYERVLK